MLKIAGISLTVLFCSLLIKDKSRSIAAILSIGGAALLVFAVLGELGTVVDKIKDLSGSSDVTDAFIKIMLKALGITLITQFVADICRDNGENALASVTEFAAKIAILALLLPLFETVIGIVGGLIK